MILVIIIKRNFYLKVYKYKKCMEESYKNLYTMVNLNTVLFFFLFTSVEIVEEEFEDAVTEQYSILFISAGVCVVVFIIFLSVLCYR